MIFRNLALGGALGVLCWGSPSAAQDPYAASISIKSLWQAFGAYNYAACIRTTIPSVPADTALRDRSIRAAQAACEDAPTRMFANTTMNGGPFPPRFIREAKAMAPKVDELLLPILRSLEPSEQPLTERLEFYGQLPNGQGFVLFPEGQNSELPDRWKFKVRLKTE